MATKTVKPARMRCVFALIVLCMVGPFGLALPGVASAQKLVAWDANGLLAVPAGDDYRAVAAGNGYSVAVKHDGSLVEWAVDGSAQPGVPAGNDYTAVAAFGTTRVALKRDGSLVTWGNALITVPPGNDYVAVAATEANIVALRRDGSLTATGWAGSGVTNVPPGNDFVAISADMFHAVALRRDGSLVDWGQSPTPAPTGNDYTAIAAGWGHGVAVKRDGSLVAWAGPSGVTAVPAGNDFVAVSSVDNLSVALRRDGTAAAWPWAGVQRPVPVPTRGFAKVAVGHEHVIALDDTAPPSIAVPDTITAKPTSSAGAAVTYAATATDAIAGPLTPACAPASNTVFAVGTTTVTCTAADGFGNRASAAFAVVVPSTSPAPVCSVKLASRKVVARRVRLVATCTARLRTRLGLRVTVHGRRSNHTSVARTVAANRRTTVAVKLPARARQALRQRARVTVAATLTAGGKALARMRATRLTR